MAEENKVICISEELFTDLIVQVGTLKEIQDRIHVNQAIGVFQKKVLLKNQQKTKDVLSELEILCNTL